MIAHGGITASAPSHRWDGAADKQRLPPGILSLLAIKDSDIRILNLEQCWDAVVAEQRNGQIWQNFRKEVLFRNRRSIDAGRIVPINALDKEGRPQFIHSGTYEGLQLAETIRKGVTT